MSLTFQPIHKDHNRKAFNCQSDALNTFLRQTARQNETRGITRTFVLVDDDNPSVILGFFTLVFCQLDAPEGSPLHQKYPHALSGLKLARFAVDQQHENKGYGALMIVHAAHKTVAAHSEVAPLLGLFADAKDDRAKAYYEGYGFRPIADDSPSDLWLPIQHCQALVQV